VIGIYMVAAAALVITGAVIGAFAVVSLAIHREERDLTLTSNVTSRAVRGARRVNGVYTTGHGSARSTP
jgi:hypothetical protein